LIVTLGLDATVITRCRRTLLGLVPLLALVRTTPCLGHDSGLQCVAGDTMCSAYAPCGRTVCQQRREGMREGTYTVREPENVVFLPARARPSQNLRLHAVVALRRRRPDVRNGPRELDAEDLARVLRHPRAVSASALPHPARRARTRVHAVALHDGHPVQAERANVDEHVNRARRGARRVAEVERAGVALTVAQKHSAHHLRGGEHYSG
jgi:hypothetical protein